MNLKKERRMLKTNSLINQICSAETADLPQMINCSNCKQSCFLSSVVVDKEKILCYDCEEENLNSKE